MKDRDKGNHTTRPWNRALRPALGVLLSLALILWMLPKMLDPVLRQMLYPAPPVPVPSPPPAPLVEAELGPPGGEAVSAWAYRGPEGRPRVLFFHGNGENLATLQMGGFYRELMELEVSFLAVDYPGYGRSSGKPREESLVAAAEAGLDWLEAELPPGPMVVLGWSLGAAVAAQLAAREEARIDSLILLSPWESLREIAAEHFPGWMLKLAMGRGSDTWDSAAAAGALRLSTLVIHGRQDRIIPIAHGRRFLEAFPEPPRFVEVPGAGHNDLFAHPEVWREIRRTLEAAAGA